MTYASEISELIQLTEEALRDSALSDAPTTYIDLLATLLSLQGVETWGEQLDGLNDEEYEVSCPACVSGNFIVLGEDGFFSTTDSMYMKQSTSSSPAPPKPWTDWPEPFTRGHSRTATPASHTS
ncbi:hypothetical protein [Streptomyces iakyrus]|uniref:hypothetical protein n=1 Tax=Streptomyces iakyrus TaxID=68219 RepID=UPI00368EC335